MQFKNQSNNGPLGNSSSTWADLVKNSGPNHNFDLEYAAPITLSNKKRVVVKESVSKRTDAKWSSSLIAYVFGNRPYYHHFEDFVQKTWNSMGNFEIFARNKGFLIIRFAVSSDCEKTINGGSYFIKGSLIILKKWNNKLSFDGDYHLQFLFGLDFLN